MELFGLTPRQRAKALIAIAASEHRPKLRRALAKARHVVLAASG